MSGISIRVDSHITEVDEAVDEAIRKALGLMGEVVEGYAKEDAPVDTGRLKNSITHRYQEGAEYVGSSVEYAPVQEFGDHFIHKVGKAHFLRDGAQGHIPELKAVAEETLKSI